LYWEVILKSAKGKLEVGHPAAWWETALNDLAATAMPLRPIHVAEIHGLFVLVTTDETMALYSSNRMRAVP
jgi:PIN domain nuclease of toxin-antitoxin system